MWRLSEFGTIDSLLAVLVLTTAMTRIKGNGISGDILQKMGSAGQGGVALGQRKGNDGER